MNPAEVPEGPFVLRAEAAQAAILWFPSQTHWAHVTNHVALNQPPIGLEKILFAGNLFTYLHVTCLGILSWFFSTKPSTLRPPFVFVMDLGTPEPPTRLWHPGNSTDFCPETCPKPTLSAVKLTPLLLGTYAQKDKTKEEAWNHSLPILHPSKKKLPLKQKTW